MFKEKDDLLEEETLEEAEESDGLNEMQKAHLKRMEEAEK